MEEQKAEPLVALDKVEVSRLRTNQVDVVEEKEPVDEGENLRSKQNAALHESVSDKYDLVEEEELQRDESSISNGRYLYSNFITKILVLGSCGFLDSV